MSNATPHRYQPQGCSTGKNRFVPACSLAVLILSWLLVVGHANAGTDETTKDDRADVSNVRDMDDMLGLDLEQLMQIDVTSVAGVAQPWFQTPAAMYVITSEDIRRSGFLSIPEALRMAPGLNVARDASWQWSISARGFESTFANKLQVREDGLEIYDPMFGGTLWDIHDTIIEDIDRIEVIRGPGATLWGANAVNGVINITTKSAKDTQGLYVDGGYGTLERGFGEVRYGGQLTDSAWYRVWGTYHNHNHFEMTNGGDSADDNDMTRAGFRIDAELNEAEGDTTLSIIGDMHHTDQAGQLMSIPTVGHLTSTNVRIDTRAEGFNVLFNLTQERAPDRGWHLKGYYTRTSRAAFAGYRTDRDIVDLDFQDYFPLTDRHQIIWGVNGRYTRDQTVPGPTISFDPASRAVSQVTAFVQDTITLVNDTLFAMVGSKFEHNAFTGFEYQPSARLWWTPDSDHTIWTAVSRVVRIPSRADTDLNFLSTYADTGLLAGGAPTGIYVPLSITGAKDAGAEHIQTFEAGYRQRISDGFTIDVACFYNDYEDLVINPANGLFGVQTTNGAATTYGVETAIDWAVASNWRLSASHSYLQASADTTTELSNSAQSPKNQFQVRSELDITQDLEFNAALYYVDSDTVGGALETAIGSYTRVDAGLTWRPDKNTELSIWGQNLFDPSHPETATYIPAGTVNEIPRSVYLKLTKRF